MVNPSTFAVTAGDGEIAADPRPAAGRPHARRPPRHRRRRARHLLARRPAATIGAPPPARWSTRPRERHRVSYRACLVEPAAPRPAHRAGHARLGPRYHAAAPVARLRGAPLGGRVALAWRNPSDRDFGSRPWCASSARSRPRPPTARSSTAATARRARLPVLARPVHYAVFASTRTTTRPRRAGIAAELRPAVAHAARPLEHDRAQAEVHLEPVAAADHYNVQVYLANRCCNARATCSQQLPEDRLADGRPERLERGTYVWYVFAHVKPGNAISPTGR